MLFPSYMLNASLNMLVFLCVEHWHIVGAALLRCICATGIRLLHFARSWFLIFCGRMVLMMRNFFLMASIELRVVGRRWAFIAAASVLSRFIVWMLEWVRNELMRGRGR